MWVLLPMKKAMYHELLCVAIMLYYAYAIMMCTSVIDQDCDGTGLTDIVKAPLVLSAVCVLVWLTWVVCLHDGEHDNKPCARFCRVIYYQAAPGLLLVGILISMVMLLGAHPSYIVHDDDSESAEGYECTAAKMTYRVFVISSIPLQVVLFLLTAYDIYCMHLSRTMGEGEERQSLIYTF
jgi:hypothetical protein